MFLKYNLQKKLLADTQLHMKYRIVYVDLQWCVCNATARLSGRSSNCRQHVLLWQDNMVVACGSSGGPRASERVPAAPPRPSARRPAHARLPSPRPRRHPQWTPTINYRFSSKKNGLIHQHASLELSMFLFGLRSNFEGGFSIFFVMALVGKTNYLFSYPHHCQSGARTNLSDISIITVIKSSK